jgi:SAM-dependent methyltransferase
VRQDLRAPFRAGLERARQDAYPAGEYVGQESFLCASEIRRLADRARIGFGTSVLDVCCGVAGPGRLIAADLGCDHLGLDSSASAVALARDLAVGLPCRFQVREVPPLPDGPFEVVLLLETMLAFRDKWALLADVARVLTPAGRFACTVEEGAPLTPAERSRMPDADTVWPIPLDELTALLGEVGLTVTWREQWSAAHAATATALLREFRSRADDIARQIGARALSDLIAAHELWVDWLLRGRVRKFALVAERR